MEIKNAQASYYEEMITLAANSPRETFRIAKKLLKVQTPFHPSLATESHCNELAEYFFNKIQTIESSFDSNESHLSPLAENLSVERDKPYLVTFPLMDTLQSIFLAIKSGSPCDPAPPKILKQVIGIVSAVICELINLSIYLFRDGSSSLEKCHGEGTSEKAISRSG